ncbi:capsid maturation protease [Arthrobacter phage Pureglobe5]|nr:capsid maturation protease and MuF-like fusion protein [Arthrobacter phage Beagle]UYL87389.1 capsid maturation protease [Arthrobacter phage Pureglobe5]
MIRTESFAASTEEFAAGRRKVLDSAADRIRGAAREALGRIGLPSWEMQIVDAALDVFDTTARAEVDEWSPVIDDMRDLFALEMSTTLQKTTRSQNPEYQLDLITNWAATYAVNAGTEAATTADPDEGVGLEWVTMSDDKVREPHREANGQTVPTGHTFEVGGAQLMYPGQPVGDPENWINCRCVVRPTMLTEASATITAAATNGDGVTSTVIVALPAADDPISMASSEAAGAHATLLFLGDSANLDEAALNTAVGEFIAKGGVGVIVDKVSGTATLGADQADVILLDATNLKALRDGLLGQDTLAEAYAAVEQFPTWIPHVTLGYPDAPRVTEYSGEAVTFNRLAVWHGESRTEFLLGEAMPESLTAAGETPAPATTPEEGQAFDDLEEEMASLVDADTAFPDVPWHGVLAPEGVPSGDGRQFAVGALTNRDLPLPLKFQWVDADGHKGSFPVGRIDRIWREDGVIKAEGVFDSSAAGYETIRLLANGIMRGVSVDLDSAEVSPNSSEKLIEFAKGRIASATICSIPAFAEAYVALGLWADVSRETAVPVEASAEEFDAVPPKTMDGPGWITDPQPTHKITSYWVDGRGAAKIAWGAPGDFNRCRTHLAKYVQNPEWLAGLCANLHYRALGAWPGQASAATVTATGEMDSLVASAAIAKALPSADDFRDPQFEDLTPFTVEDDGRVFGHLAGWDTCHIGYEECVTAPSSETQYAYFLTGEVRTDAGPVAVGQISLGGGHAPGKFGLRAAVAHYDSTSAAVADVTCGEDMHGIWVAGRLRDGVSEKQIKELRAAAISGDWRGVRMRGRRSQELVAALAVNVPGFPIPRTAFGIEDGEQMSLVAAGIVPKAPVAEADPDRIQKLRELTFNIRDLHVSDIKKQLTSLKGK